MENKIDAYCLQVSSTDGVLTLQTMPDEKQVYVRFTYDSPRRKPFETMIPFEQFQALASAMHSEGD